MSFRACLSRTALFTMLTAIVVTGCSRDHEIKPRSVFPDDIPPACEAVPDESIQFVSDVQINDQVLTPAFNQDTLAYSAEFGYPVREARIRVRVPSDQPDGVLVSSVSLSVNGTILSRFDESEAIALSVGSNEIVVNVDASVQALPFSDECLDAQDAGEVELAEFAEIKKRYVIEVNRSGQNGASEQVVLLDDLSRDAGDRFGYAIARYDRLMAIGVPYEDGNASGILGTDGIENQNNASTDSGAMYLYELEADGSWQAIHYFKAPNNGAGDLYGAALALNEEWMAVAAPREDGSASDATVAAASAAIMSNDTASNSGAVYVYRRLGDAWEFHSYVKPPLNDIGVNGFDDGFGERLAIKDGRLFIAAPREDSGSTGSLEDNSVASAGAVYVYSYNTSLDNWRYTSTIKSDYAQAGDFFGHALALQGDLIAISAPGEDSSFRDIDTKAIEQEELDNLNELEPDDPRRLVLEARTDGARADSGAVFLFENNAGVITWKAILKSSNSDAGDGFGRSLALAENRMVVGAPFEDGNGRAIDRNMSNNDRVDSGAAYVFSFQNGRWAENTYLKSVDSMAGNQFGASLSLLESDLLVGAPRQDNAFTNNGAGYYFEYVEGSWRQTAFEEFGQSDEARFGARVVLGDDALIFSSPGFIDSSSGSDLDNVGRVYVHQY